MFKEKFLALRMSTRRTVAPRSAPRCSRICVPAALDLVLLSSSSARAEPNGPAGSPIGIHDTYMAPCDRTLKFTELGSKPGLKCTDFAPVFSLYELDPEPAEGDHRPTTEVNYYIRLFKTLEEPSEEAFYGFTQASLPRTYF